MFQKTSDPAESLKPIMYFHHAGLTNTGLVRDHNEDAYKLPEDADADTLASNGHLYVLADGMGGHQKGEVASEVTIKAVNSEYYATVKRLAGDNPEKSIIEALTKAIQKANDDVMEATEGGGTTVVVAVLHGHSLVAMNVATLGPTYYVTMNCALSAETIHWFRAWLRREKSPQKKL